MGFANETEYNNWLIGLHTLEEEVMMNYPEFSRGMPMVCEEWDYKEGTYKFLDTETGERHVVKLPQIKDAIEKFKQMLFEGKYHRHGNIQLTNNVGNWDADDTDAVVQIAIFGDVIYG